MNIIIMGPQGSGKSTQAELLAKKLGFAHLQTGELGRRLASRGSLIGKKIKRYIDQGVLFPDKWLMQILTGELKKPSLKKGFVLDGTPRTLAQAKILPFKVDQVFYLKVSDQINTERLLKRGRQDDTSKLIKKRLALYHQKTEPILAFYRQQGILTEIDGEQPIEPIHQDIVNQLRK